MNGVVTTAVESPPATDEDGSSMKLGMASNS